MDDDDLEEILRWLELLKQRAIERRSIEQLKEDDPELTGCILPASSLIYAEVCPQEIRDAGDEPWHFVGESTSTPVPLFVNVPCSCGGVKSMFMDGNLFRRPAYEVVCLRGYTFITDDMLKVQVYWGRCDNCRRIYWSRSGPPFNRARVFVPA